MLFKHEDQYYENIADKYQNKDLLDEYRDNVRSFLLGLHPDKADIIESYMDYILKNKKNINITLETYFNKRRRVSTEVPLVEYSKKSKKYINAPSGTSYYKKEKKVSIISELIQDYIDRRTFYKKKQFESLSSGDHIGEIRNFLIQSHSKVFNNSIFGATGAPASFLYDLHNFNSITSIARQSVITGYVHVERMLESNLYMPDLSSVLNYINLMTKKIDKPNVLNILNKYNIYQPTEEDLYNFFISNMSFYSHIEIHKKVKLKFCISKLDDAEKAVVYYTYSLKHLFTKNITFFKTFLRTLFNRDISLNKDVDLKRIFDIEDTLFNMVLSRNFNLINKENRLDKAIELYPEGVRHLISISHHMEFVLNKYSDILTLFFRSDIHISNIWGNHPKLLRKATVVSDTDSAIFTTDKLISQLDLDHSFSQDSLDANAFFVYMISKTLEHSLALMTSGCNIRGEDKYKISMKNEFYYPIFIWSQNKKNYIGNISIQEGKILPEPKLDIKGLSFRSSNLPKESIDYFNDFLKWLFKNLEENVKVSYKDFMKKIALHEMRIYKSIVKGEKTFLSMNSIKTEKEYKVPLSSIYFYYLFWKDVFATTYGPLELPNRVYSIPIRNDGKFLLSEKYNTYLKETNIDIYNKLNAFIDRYASKKITRLIIPSDLVEIPEIIKPLIDIRKIIYVNNGPFYLLSGSFGISLNIIKDVSLFSDFLSTNEISSLEL